MRDHGIYARHKRRYKVTTDSKHGLPVAENLLARNFTPKAANQVWTSDMTYLWTDEGWLYLAIVLDLFNREVVGWSHKPRMTADIVTDALTMAWFRKKPAPGLLHHSDRGSQYASHAFQDKLKEYGMTCSMSRKGNCWDNAPTESWFNSFKNERVHGVRYATHAAIKAAAFEYIEVFYNRKRQYSTLGYKSPTQFLVAWLSGQHEEKLVASNPLFGRRKTEGTSNLAAHGLSPAVQPVHRDFRAGDVRDSQVDLGKAQRLLGYAPTHQLAEGVAEAMAWYVGQGTD